MKSLLISIAAFTIMASTQAQNNTEFSITNQIINWKGKAAVGGYAPEGTLIIKNGMLKLEKGEVSALSITIDMTSLSQENKQLSGHLKEEDFFHVEKYPEALFTMTGSPVPSENGHKISGTMTIKDKTNPETIVIQLIPQGTDWVVKFRHTMDRTRYGVVYNSPSIFKRIKENAIADEFEIWAALKFTERE